MSDFNKDYINVHVKNTSMSDPLLTGSSVIITPDYSLTGVTDNNGDFKRMQTYTVGVNNKEYTFRGFQGDLTIVKSPTWQNKTIAALPTGTYKTISFLMTIQNGAGATVGISFGSGYYEEVTADANGVVTYSKNVGNYTLAIDQIDKLEFQIKKAGYIGIFVSHDFYWIGDYHCGYLSGVGLVLDSLPPPTTIGVVVTVYSGTNTVSIGETVACWNSGRTVSEVGATDSTGEEDFGNQDACWIDVGTKHSISLLAEVTTPTRFLKVYTSAEEVTYPSNNEPTVGTYSLMYSFQVTNGDGALLTVNFPALGKNKNHTVNSMESVMGSMMMNSQPTEMEIQVSKTGYYTQRIRTPITWNSGIGSVRVNGFRLISI